MEGWGPGACPRLLECVGGGGSLATKNDGQRQTSSRPGHPIAPCTTQAWAPSSQCARSQSCPERPSPPGPGRRGGPTGTRGCQSTGGAFAKTFIAKTFIAKTFTPTSLLPSTPPTRHPHATWVYSGPRDRMRRICTCMCSGRAWDSMCRAWWGCRMRHKVLATAESSLSYCVGTSPWKAAPWPWPRSLALANWIGQLNA